MSGPRTFHVVDGTPPPDTPENRALAKRKTNPQPAEMLSCPSCTSHALIEIRMGVLLINGKATRGTRQLICALCLQRGRHVVVF